MPLTRYQIRNEYGLADPELYAAADKDDPEALLEGVAMAGLVGVLRQLGDLAEFAAEIFHDLHEEVMVTAARGHGLVVRVQQLEAEFPSIEKALLSQTNHSSFFTNAGVDWHPNLRSEQNLVTRGDLPRFVMDSYEECRGPPRLFLLDKFDVAGAGACLKRYTDPSFFKVEAASSGMATVEYQREKKTRKAKKGSRWRNGETPEVIPASTKLHQLFLEERIENGYSDPARLVKLKRRQLNGSAIDSKGRKSYMEKFVETPSPEHKMVCETSVSPSLLKLTSENTSESGLRILEIGTVSSAEKSPLKESACSSPNDHEVVLKALMNGFNEGVASREIVKVPEPPLNDETVDIPSTVHDEAVEQLLSVNEEDKTEGSVNGYASDDVTSEVDNYMDALATMESEIETDNEYKPKNNLHLFNTQKHGTDFDANEENSELQAQLSDSQSVGNFSMSDDGNNSFKKNRSSFSCSDTPSSLVENTPSDCDGVSKVVPSTATGAEIADVPSNQLSVIDESLVTTSNELVVSHDTRIQGVHCSDVEDASSSVLLEDLNSIPVQLDPGTSLSTAPLMGSKIDEMPTEHIMLGSTLPSTDEKGVIHVDLPSVIPDVSSATNYDYTNTSESFPQNEDGDPNVTSDALPHFSNISELAFENTSRDNSMNGLFHTQHEDEDSKQNLPSASEEEKQFCSSALAEEACSANLLLTDSLPASSSYYSDVVESDNLISKVDDAVTAAVVNYEVLPPMVDSAQSTGSEETPSAMDSSQTQSLMGQQFSDSGENVHNVPVTAEMGVTYSKEKSYTEESSRVVDSEEICLSTSYMDAVDENPVSLGLLSNLPDYPGSDGHINSDDVVPEPVNGVDLSMPSVVVDDAVGDVNNVSCMSRDAVCSPSRDLTDLRESPLGSEDHLEKEVEFDEAVCSPSGDLTDLREYPLGSEDHLEKEVEFDEAVCSPSRDLTDLRESPFGSEDHLEKEVEFEEAVSPKYLMESEAQKQLGQLDVAPTNLDSNTCMSVPYDRSSSKIVNDVHDLSQNSLPVGDIGAVSTPLEMKDEESESKSPSQSNMLDYMEDAELLPTCNLPESNTVLEKSLKSQADQADVECLQSDDAMLHPETPSEESQLQSDQPDVKCLVDQVNSNSSVLSSEEVESLDLMDKEKCEHRESRISLHQDLNVSSESLQEKFPSQPSTSEFLPESVGQEVDNTKQAFNSSESVFPSFGLLHEPAQVDLGEMPPLPPLPPMQWRMGKSQHTSLMPQRLSVEPYHDLFSPIQPSKANERAQFEVPASQSGLQQPENLFLPLTIVENKKSVDISEPLASNLMLPTTYSLQLPEMVHDANGQFSHLAYGGTQSLNPFLTLPVTSNEKPGHSYLAFEGDMVQSGSNPFLPGPTTEYKTPTHDHVISEEAIQPPKQLALETTIDNKVNEQPLDSSGEQGTKHSSEEQGTKHSSEEQGTRFITSVQTSTLTDEQYQLSLPMTKGETAWSSGISTMALVTDFENGQANGSPTNKLPRPRNPLIDAVNAHGKSKLRKVTERVRPQIGPKLDERDSLLEQIRTKSFNLKPAATTRPSIQGPKTNLKVAAILEKANAIRQALAPSDEDDDDNWSDS
ncbi:protein SCAR2 isoform X2 [Ziziphus jujuba]|uniref:Protein SCAR n=1 Tax=Ziziphus jujuba TaxID=326968 RepID=A0ABM3I324_ZIZJJ|nr:protein SCAR2 isoform X2 [Ziziphus jujuba]